MNKKAGFFRRLWCKMGFHTWLIKSQKQCKMHEASLLGGYRGKVSGVAQLCECKYCSEKAGFVSDGVNEQKFSYDYMIASGF